jgi:hypothetical protein
VIARGRALALLAGVAAAACGGGTDSPPQGPAPVTAPEPRLLRLDELEVAVKRNLARGALVNLWATW